MLLTLHPASCSLKHREVSQSNLQQYGFDEAKDRDKQIQGKLEAGGKAIGVFDCFLWSYLASLHLLLQDFVVEAEHQRFSRHKRDLL